MTQRQRIQDSSLKTAGETQAGLQCAPGLVVQVMPARRAGDGMVRQFQYGGWLGVSVHL